MKHCDYYLLRKFNVIWLLVVGWRCILLLEEIHVNIINVFCCNSASSKFRLLTLDLILLTFYKACRSPVLTVIRASSFTNTIEANTGCGFKMQHVCEYEREMLAQRMTNVICFSR